MKKNITIEFITKTVCNYIEVPSEYLNSKTRQREIVQARQISMYFSKQMTKTSLKEIGAQIGGKDHATVITACKKISGLIDVDKKFRAEMEEIEKLIFARKPILTEKQSVELYDFALINLFHNC